MQNFLHYRVLYVKGRRSDVLAGLAGGVSFQVASSAGTDSTSKAVSSA